MPDTFEQPAGSGAELDADWLRALDRDRDPQASPLSGTTMIATVLSDEFDGLGLAAAEAMQVKPLASAFGKLDFKKYRRPEPTWIANRIACMPIAVELLRNKDLRSALFSRARHILHHP